ncbi:MAG: hypothetical protein ILA07_04930 [Prevotella sp.]|nr:hypothetical protein [Prevotella sp.]
MNKKRQAQRARRAAQEEANAKNIIKWICVGLIAIALIYVIFVFAHQ